MKSNIFFILTKLLAKIVFNYILGILKQKLIFIELKLILEK